MIGVGVMAVCVAVVLTSARADDDVMTKEEGAFVVNTTTLAADVDGYEGPVPLKIYIRKDKIEKIEALKNLETPKYFAMIKKKLLDKWNGMSVKEAASAEIDGVTGATYSSDAVKENVRRGISYYKSHQKK